MNYVVFDLDGTLTDSSEGIMNAFRVTIEKAGLEVPSNTDLFSFIGPPVLDTFQDYFGMDYESARKWTEVFREEYSTHRLFENRPYDGIKEMLAALQEAGCVIGMATAKPEEYALKILEHFDLAQYIQYPYGASLDHVTLTKKSEILKNALHAADKDYSISSIYMVGDRQYDVHGANAHGVPCIGVTYGFGDREALVEAGADYIVDTPQAVVDVVLKGNIQ